MRYLVIGAGPAGVIAAETLHGLDPDAQVVLLGDEPEPPYSRMALPYLLAGNVGEPGTYLRHGDGHYESLGIEVRRARVQRLEPGAHRAVLEGGETISFDRALVATGSRPTRPPVPGMDLPGIDNCWTLADARRIAEGARPGAHIVLLGAGFIGCIVLEALVARGVRLTVVESEDRMLPRMMDEAGGALIERWCESKGVTVLTGTRIEGVETAGDGLALRDSVGGTIEADGVVCATGVRPNVELLEGSGIEVDQGVLVDSRLRSSVEDVYAAGDVAQGPDFSTGERVVHAIQPTASEHGRIAARNMAGLDTPYRGSLSMNVLNTLGLVSSSFGLWMGCEGGKRSLAHDPEGFRYLRLELDEDRLVGALALGLTQHVGVVRGLIQTRVRLGPWRERLLRDPTRVMEAYLERTQGGARMAEEALRA